MRAYYATNDEALLGSVLLRVRLRNSEQAHPKSFGGFIVVDFPEHLQVLFVRHAGLEGVGVEYNLAHEPLGPEAFHLIDAVVDK